MTAESGSTGFAALDATVRVYYGAAVTCVAMARATIRELLAESPLEQRTDFCTLSAAHKARRNAVHSQNA